jgi:beta-glucosidase
MKGRNTMTTSTTPFPQGFVWGAAASAYQTEGAVDVDGRGTSIWDRFCAEPGRIKDGTSGAVACDFYGRHREDIELMRSLGLDAFRFSVAWPRVLPRGTGAVNTRGLDFYDRLVDDLLAAGIEPFVNLFHWDLPLPLEDAGGWPARATAEHFAAYAGVVGARLGDRVRHWITHNEPACASWLGYGTGVHAPGHGSDAEALAAAHHLLLSHGWAVGELRRCSPRSEVGIVVDSWPAFPWSESDEDRAAARLADGMTNRWFFDALFHGAYPEDMLEHFDGVLPTIADGDLAVIATPLDFVGANNYSRHFVRANPAGGRPLDVRAPAGELTAMGWEVYPSGIREVLTRLHRGYGVDTLYVAENGAAFGDVRTHDGAIHDVDRIRYLESYVSEVAAAIADGVPVRGYFVWSLLDNFEWAEGYSKRFGLVYVDYPTLQRVPKDSFFWYRDLIERSRGITLAA